MSPFGPIALRIDRLAGIIRAEGLPDPEYELVQVKIEAEVKWPLIAECYSPVYYEAGMLCAKVPANINPNDVYAWKAIVTPAADNMRWADDGGRA